MKYHSGLKGGDMKIASADRKGTTVTSMFSTSHIDRKTIGGMSEPMIILIAANPVTDFLYTHKTDNGEYRFPSLNIKKELAINNFSDNGLLSDIKKMISIIPAKIKVSDFKEIIANYNFGRT